MISSLFKNLAIYFHLTNSTRTYNQPNPHESKTARNNPTTYLHRLQYNDRQRQRTLPYPNFIPNNNNCAVSVDEDNFLYQQQLPVLTHNTPYSSNLSTITCKHVSKQFRNKRNPSQSSRIRRLESGVKRFNSKIDMLKEKQSFNETINVTYNTEKLKEQIILWILKEKNFLGTVTDQAIIDKIADKISSSFTDDAKSAILFLCYTCFLTKTFVGFREMHFGNPVNILIIQHPLSTFDLAALEVAIDKWKTFKLDYTSMREGYEKIQMVIQELDPSWLFFCNQKIYSSFKITTIFCLGHFFEKESDLK